MHRSRLSRLVWDKEGLIQAQYERKLRPQTFGRTWYEELLLRGQVHVVARQKLDRGTSTRIRATGLVGEDFMYYVRTSASSPDRRLVTADSDYDAQTCKCLKRELDVEVLDAHEGVAFLEGG